MLQAQARKAEEQIPGKDMLITQGREAEDQVLAKATCSNYKTKKPGTQAYKQRQVERGQRTDAACKSL